MYLFCLVEVWVSAVTFMNFFSHFMNFLAHTVVYTNAEDNHGPQLILATIDMLQHVAFHTLPLTCQY
jgi:hypothetical protein